MSNLSVTNTSTFVRRGLMYASIAFAGIVAFNVPRMVEKNRQWNHEARRTSQIEQLIDEKEFDSAISLLAKFDESAALPSADLASLATRIALGKKGLMLEMVYTHIQEKNYNSAVEFFSVVKQQIDLDSVTKHEYEERIEGISPQNQRDNIASASGLQKIVFIDQYLSHVDEPNEPVFRQQQFEEFVSQTEVKLVSLQPPGEVSYVAGLFSEWLSSQNLSLLSDRDVSGLQSSWKRYVDQLKVSVQRQIVPGVEVVLAKKLGKYRGKSDNEYYSDFNELNYPLGTNASSHSSLEIFCSMLCLTKSLCEASRIIAN